MRFRFVDDGVDAGVHLVSWFSEPQILGMLES